MLHRPIADIFPPSYPNPLDAEEIQRLCASHLAQAQQLEDVYLWIKRETCPYRQEALAEGMLLTLQQSRTDEFDDRCKGLTTYMWDELQMQLNSIIRHAQAFQLAENMLFNSSAIQSQPSMAATLPRVEKLEKQFILLTQQVESLTQQIQQEHPDTTVHWPYYTPTATEKDKLLFESQLQKLFHSHQRGMTSSIKTYLTLKVDQNIITRPSQINEEWSILQAMGYPRAQSTYYGA